MNKFSAHFLFCNAVSIFFYHIFRSSAAIYLLETARKSSDSALQEAADIGVKTKDLRSLKKSRNCGIFKSIFPELRVETPQGLKQLV
jgi:hypothetical protein